MQHEVFAQSDVNAAGREFFQIAAAQTQPQFARCAVFRHFFGDFSVGNIHQPRHIARAVQQRYRPAQDFDLLRQGGVHHQGMVGREIRHVARFAVMVQHFNPSARLPAYHRRGRAAAVLRSMDARHAVERVAEIDGFLPQSIAADDFVGGSQSVQQPRSSARMAFTDDVDRFQVHRLLGFMRVGENGGTD